MILPLLLITAFWAATYAFAGWSAVLVMALFGVLAELLLLGLCWREGRGAR